MGPVLVTTDEIPNPQTLAIKCELNGHTVQDSSTSEMIFGVAQLISFCSNAFTLEPGDVILTGTPHGTGAFRDPKLFMQNDDKVAVEIEGIGRLENHCEVTP
jgi:5-carboxymethyl-2-hydroxymuconate isomerase